ncbi:GntR family transcriptional regulator [Microbacterium sp. ASV49]|uniref:GntR family transcriptional regulator n=1 Tax=Microbacterium candidum TaxID=3041922 RepID=A0ABT7N113_9MICO|nr:GntR family transcriptional regulator [Microbacterium sp. ASV49]MDL9980393.1 GntR family transcriptional regulator [Microbacterium sp. ASV49]
MAASHPSTPQRSAPARTLRYQHVYDLVIELIEEQGLREGARLPSTAELAELAGVSVISVRRALDELDRDGKIVRHQGVGTFVAPQRILSTPSARGGLLETLTSADRGLELTTELIGLIVGIPSAKHAAALRIDEGAPVWEISRVRRLGSTPKVLERAVVPLSLVPSLDEKHLATGGSLYGFLAEKHGFVDEYVEQAIEVDRPTSWEREHLELGPRADVVRIRGVSADAAGVPFDSFQQTYPAHDFVFYISGSSDRRLVEPTHNGPWSVQSLGGGS